MKFKITSIPLFIIFIAQTVFFALKVTKAINWDWLWVLSPLWLSYAFTIIIALFAVLFVLGYKIKERIFEKNG